MYGIIFPLLAMFTATFGNVQGLSNEASELLGRLSRDVVLEYFLESQCLAVVTEDENSIVDFIHPLDFPVFHVQLSSFTLKNSERKDAEFEEYDWDTSLLAPMNAGCLAFIVQTSNMNFMVETFSRIAHSSQSSYRANRRYLYLPTREVSEESFDESISKLFSRREMDFMPDLVIVKLILNLLRDDKRRLTHQRGMTSGKAMKHIELITHRFIGHNPSEQVTLDFWDRDRGFLVHNDLYANKMNNMMGKEIIISSLPYPPCTVILFEEDPQVFDGLEFQLMYEWAKKNNFTWQIVYDLDNWWGEIWENGSGNGLSGLVSEDKADIAFAAIYLWAKEYQFTDYSTAYFWSAITTVTPKPKLLPEWLVPVRPFSPTMWGAVIVSILITAAVLYVTSYSSMKLLGTGHGKTVVNMYSTWVECLFRTMGLLVLQVPPDERDYSTPRHVPMRHLVTWLILFYLVVTTAYGGGLASVLTIPKYELPIETASDLAEHNMIWGAMDDAFVFFIKGSSDPKMKILAKNFRLESEEYLTGKTKTREMAFVVERMQGGHFALPPYINEDSMKYLRVMKEDLVYGHCVYMLRKGTPFMDNLNSIIFKLHETGIILYWEHMTVRKYMSSSRQSAVINSRNNEDPGPTKLLVVHISGAIYMLIFGLIMAQFTFILEIIRHRYYDSKKFIKINNILK